MVCEQLGHGMGNQALMEINEDTPPNRNIGMPPVAERLRWAYPALPERAGVGSILANSDTLNVPSFRRWQFEMKLSPFTPPKDLSCTEYA
jgi:hypothetical protein